jgi:hypothetical protein
MTEQEFLFATAEKIDTMELVFIWLESFKIKSRYPELTEEFLKTLFEKYLKYYYNGKEIINFLQFKGFIEFYPF